MSWLACAVPSPLADSLPPAGWSPPLLSHHRAHPHRQEGRRCDPLHGYRCVALILPRLVSRRSADARPAVFRCRKSHSYRQGLDCIFCYFAILVVSFTLVVNGRSRTARLFSLVPPSSRRSSFGKRLLEKLPSHRCTKRVRDVKTRDGPSARIRPPRSRSPLALSLSRSMLPDWLDHTRR